MTATAIRLWGWNDREACMQEAQIKLCSHQRFKSSPVTDCSKATVDSNNDCSLSLVKDNQIHTDLGKPGTSSWNSCAASLGQIRSHYESGVSWSICKRLCTGPLLVQQIEANKHGSPFSRRQCALIPEAQSSAHRGAQLATLHGYGQLCSTLDAQLLCLHCKERTAIGLWCGEAKTHAEDVVEPEGVTKASAPIKELLSTPAIATSKLFVEANANGWAWGWWKGALIRDAQANADVGAEGITDVSHLTWSQQITNILQISGQN